MRLHDRCIFYTAVPTCRSNLILENCLTKCGMHCGSSITLITLRYNTEKTYVHWIRRFILFHNKRHPSEVNTPEVTQFLTHLAVNEQVAAATQNQALSAIAQRYGKADRLSLSHSFIARVSRD
jgi:hypothetical protein